MKKRSSFAVLAVAFIFALLPFQGGGRSSAKESPTYTPASETDGFIVYQTEQGAGCRHATPEEALDLLRAEGRKGMRVINPHQVNALGGLTVVLRGTPQLEAFPDARDGFIEAAALWGSFIQTPITIVIDVDFGPTRFGTPFAQGVLGSTNTQLLLSSSGYPNVRAKLIAGASSPTETQLYNALPGAQVPTDIGTTVAIATPSATLRALGEINSDADVALEPNFGLPPAVGFNSNFLFDFDPTDGIDPNRIDFEAVAVHEIGHALGFSSRIGVREIDSSATLAVSVFDLFRFRPGVTLATFPTANRILSSGGEHVFFAGAPELRLSTGRSNGTGGDGFQGSHFKDDSFGEYIGIMDPAIAFGERNEITDNDLKVFDSIGYTLRSTPAPTIPLISVLSANLDGDILTLAGAALDAEMDVNHADVAIFDATGAQLGTAPLNLAPPPATAFGFEFDFSGLNEFPTAALVTMRFTDAAGNQGSPVLADFSLADPNGPELRKVNFFDVDVVMVIKGSGLSGNMELEVNGVTVAPPARLKPKASAAKLKALGTMSELNLHTGANRIRLTANGLRSNIFVLNL